MKIFRKALGVFILMNILPLICTILVQTEEYTHLEVYLNILMASLLIVVIVLLTALGIWLFTDK